MSIPPIYIINLKRTPERRLSMQRQLDAFNLNYQFVDGIDKHELHSKEYRAATAYQIGVDESTLEHLFEKQRHIVLACKLSHLKVYNLMKKHRVPRACVLEDDGYLMPVFPKILAASQEAPWDILMLSHHSSTTLLELAGGYPKTLSDAYTILYKLMRYKKYYPQLNPYTIRLMIWEAVKFYLRKNFYQENKHDYWCTIGAIPDPEKSSWHKITPKHYISKPYLENDLIGSAMGYMVTLPAAMKWKEEALRSNKHIDYIPHFLYQKGKINLRILVPPCVLIIRKYITYSAR